MPPNELLQNVPYIYALSLCSYHTYWEWIVLTNICIIIMILRTIVIHIHTIITYVLLTFRLLYTSQILIFVSLLPDKSKWPVDGKNSIHCTGPVWPVLFIIHIIHIIHLPFVNCLLGKIRTRIVNRLHIAGSNNPRTTEIILFLFSMEFCLRLVNWNTSTLGLEGIHRLSLLLRSFFHLPISNPLQGWNQLNWKIPHESSYPYYAEARLAAIQSSLPNK